MNAKQQTTFHIKTTDLGNGSLSLQVSCTLNKKVLRKVLQTATVIFISLLIAINFPGAELLLQQVFSK